MVSLIQASTSQSILWLSELRAAQHLAKSITSLFLIVTVNMNSKRAPKQWSLTKNETITTFEAWRQNLQYSLSLDANFAPFLADNFLWLKKSSTSPERGLTSDGEDVPTCCQRTANQKNVHFELMLGQIANFCPVISRNSIVKNSTSIKSIWQAIRAHYGFQSTGAHFLDFSIIKLDADECPEDFFQRLVSFIEDNLLMHLSLETPTPPPPFTPGRRGELDS